jgi:UDP-glucose 4-epimerase
VAIDRLIEGQNKKNIEFFNLGTGNGSSVLEILNGFEKATGVKVPYEIVERRAGDIEKVWADTTFANNELGWKTEVSLEDSLRSVWNWQKKLQ